jgi:hypothetical protein
MLSHEAYSFTGLARQLPYIKKISFAENFECCIEKKERIMCEWHPHLFYFCADMVLDTFSTLWNILEWFFSYLMQGWGKGIFRILGFLKWYIVRQAVYYKMTPSIFLGIISIKARNWMEEANLRTLPFPIWYISYERHCWSVGLVCFPHSAFLSAQPIFSVP